ncbi:MAG: hypothetical protein R3A48_11215 [Polyangiales bacterium]
MQLFDRVVAWAHRATWRLQPLPLKPPSAPRRSQAVASRPANLLGPPMPQVLPCGRADRQEVEVVAGAARIPLVIGSSLKAAALDRDWDDPAQRQQARDLAGADRLAARG